MNLHETIKIKIYLLVWTKNRTVNDIFHDDLDYRYVIKKWL